MTERKIGDPVGYSDVWSVAPGETIRFMVSTSSATYRALLVQLSGADPQFQNPIPSPVDGVYRGRTQVARLGSGVIVERAETFQSLTSVSVCIWAWPTRLKAGREQVLVNGGPWMLFIDEAGIMRFRVTSEAGVAELRAGQPLTERAWSFVCGSYDAESGHVTLYWHELGLYAPTPQVVGYSLPPGRLARGHSTLFIAIGSRAHVNSRAWGEGHFDGKLEAPTIYNRALNVAELTQIVDSHSDEAYPTRGLVGAWRFQREIAGDRIIDIGPSAAHGRTINAPTRAMTGHTWRAKESDPRLAPDDYGAIHFHADDLEDASWESDFALRVPDDLCSGVYAIKLTSSEGGEDVVPFVVRTSREAATSDVALVLPTLTYLAYANERLTDADSYQSYRFEDQPDVSEWDAWLTEHPEFGLSLYDSHADGSGCCYSTRLRPIPSLRPDYLASALWFPRHLAADLFIVQWLDRMGFKIDILTDEDLDIGGTSAVADYRVILTGSHPEYVTERMLDALDEYVSQGGRLMYLGGNGFCWVTSIRKPRGHLIEVRRGQTNQLPWDSCPGELHHSTTGELGGLWELRGRPARALVGVGTAAMGKSAQPYSRTRAAYDPRYAWVFEGLTDEELIGGGGLVLGEPGGYEIDRCDTSLGSPAEAVVLARAEGKGTGYELFSPGSIFVAKPPVGNSPHACADMTLLETSNGGAVFSVGSIAWAGGLPLHNGNNTVSTVTRNVLTAFLAEEIPTSSRCVGHAYHKRNSSIE